MAILGAMLVVCVIAIALRSIPRRSIERVALSMEPSSDCASGVIAAGTAHSLALRTDGVVVGWGSNGDNELSEERFNFVNGPIVIRSLPRVASVHAGWGGSAFVADDGSVWRLGVGYMPGGSSQPKRVPGITGAVAVAVGWDHMLALLADGSVWAWGRNGEGQLGDGTTETRSDPVQVEILSDVAGIAANRHRSIAVKLDGTVWMWGDGTLVPTRVEGLDRIAQVAIGNLHQLAVGVDGSVWTWGTTELFVELGTTESGGSPARVMGLPRCVMVAAGRSSSYALASDGHVWSWGYNTLGELGDGTLKNRRVPARIPLLSQVVAISVTSTHVLALRADGTVWQWGSTGKGLLDAIIVQKRPSLVLLGGKCMLPRSISLPWGTSDGER